MERGAPHLYYMIQYGIDDKLNTLALIIDKLVDKAVAPRPIHVPNTKLVGVAVTRIQVAKSGYTNDHEQHLRFLQIYWEDSLLEPYIRHGTGVSSALSVGRLIYSREGIPNWSQNIEARGIHTQFRDLTNEIKQKIDAL